MTLEEILNKTHTPGVWEMLAVSKCGTAVKFARSNGTEVVVTVNKIKQWMQEKKCSIENNRLIWNTENLSKPKF